MRCCVCSSNDWESVQQWTIQKEGISVCKKCGFVSYPTKWKSKEEIIKFYRKEYRDIPSINNIYTGQTKLQYHQAFLKDLIMKWKSEKKNPTICDVGSALGMFPHMMKRIFPGGDIGGTELTLSFRRNAFHHFNVLLTEDIDESKKYDMISSYKVLEHQLDFDLELERYHRLLNDDGYFYLSIPVWFDDMICHGSASWNIIEYYHPNHINVWSEKNILSVLKRVGFTIEKHDRFLYGFTYLLRKTDPMLNQEYDNHERIKSCMESIWKANDLFIKNNFDESIKHWSNSPISWVRSYEMKRAQLDPFGYEHIVENHINPAMNACPYSSEVVFMAADISLRYDMIEQAMGYINRCLEMRPNHPMYLSFVAKINRLMAERCNDESVKVEHLIEARKLTAICSQISDREIVENTNWIMRYNAGIPIPCEEKEKKDGIQSERQNQN